MNGSPELPCTPIIAATIIDAAGIVMLLIKKGADADGFVNREVVCPSSGYAILPGERSLHIAAVRGNVEIVRLLLERARANPNVTDETGSTPLLIACACLHNGVELVQLLLEAGADPASADKNGANALHAAAQHTVVST